MNHNHPVQTEDLEFISEKLFYIFPSLKNAKFFITGATGFFGCWLLESLIYLNVKHDLNLEIIAMTRNKESFKKKYPHFFQYKFINFFEADVVSFDIKETNFTHIIHAAFETNLDLINSNPKSFLFDGICGIKNTLDLAKNNPNSKYLFISSGAVYGKQFSKTSEEDPSRIDLTKVNSCYAEAKRIGEILVNFYAKNHAVQTKIARCFSFVGPYMKFNSHYAIGNFINDIIFNNSLKINSDGKAVRSYLYAADLVIWLLIILEKGFNLPYNVGSENEISIIQLAKLIKKIVGNNSDISLLKLPVNNSASGSDFYVPNTKRARDQLNLSSWTSVESAILKTINFLKK